jgi:2-dehydro-3-deoxyphosphogluconate aldolase/(4S)-4-hydroxy-2-oxoglutarate aldolase
MSIADLRSGPVAAAIRSHRLIVVLRRVEPRDRLLALVSELADAGVRTFEVTMDGPGAAEDLAAARSALASRSDGPFLVGAGTILGRDQLEAARLAGADFGVSPLLDTKLLAATIADGLPFIPGAMTPTEAAAAWGAGATFVKLFPASAVGPSFVRELRGPLPDLAVIPTGGIDKHNARDFLDAGAAAVGIGGAIVRASGAERAELVRSLGEPRS